MYTYRLTPSAVEDLWEIADYIANHLCAPESAIKLLEDIEDAIAAACAYPFSLPAINDALLRTKGYRKVVVKNYIAFVLPDREKEILNVMRVMYYARDYLKEL